MGIYADRLLIEQKQDQAFLQAINEVYFGRGPQINSLFNAYCDWREPFISNSKYYNSSLFKNVYNKNMDIVRELVCKQFGFKTFSYILMPQSGINSFTFSGGLTSFITRNPATIKIDPKNGYKFKEDTHVNAIVGVYADLIFNPEYSNEENFAAFLHEIGHNFQTAANNTIFSLNCISGIVNCINFPKDALYLNDVAFGVANKLQNKLATIEIAGNLYSVIASIVYSIDKCKQFFEIWKNFFLIPVDKIMKFCNELMMFLDSIVKFKHQEKYLGERFADGFAASYGFGEALASCLLKFKNIQTKEPLLDDLLNTVPVIGHIMDLVCLPGMMLLGIIDVHPRVASRCYSIISDLKQDLNDPSLSPELKKQLSKEIDDYEIYMHNYFDNALKLENPRVISSAVHKWIYDMGGDIKFKISELPYMNSGGFRGETNRTAQWINQDKYNILNTKII